MGMDTTETIHGTIDRFIYQNHENGFSICVLITQNNQSALIKGSLSHLHSGEDITAHGTWTTHPKFGRQFEIEHYSTHSPTSIVGLKKYLASGLIKGIGPAYAEKLVAHFGTEVLDIIDQQPERLHSVPGIGSKKIATIIAAWQSQKAISHIMVFLQDKGITPAYAVKIYKKYGAQSIAVVTENPYRLAQEIWGIGFAIADRIAQQVGFTLDSLNRIKAGILFAITSALGNGHLYLALEALRTQTATLLDLDMTTQGDLIKNALHELHDARAIVLITYNDSHYITQTQYYQIEQSVANHLKKCLAQKRNNSINLNSLYTRLRTQKRPLNDDQQAGIMACLQNAITIITGGPGTGKTTIIKTLLTILDEHAIHYKLAAPTGRAAKRITESSGKEATTLHRLLEFDPNTMKFTRTEKNTLSLDFLIIDEASMIDIFLAHALLQALPQSAHLILLGDVDQLPSVGAGNFLNDLIASAIIPCVRLTKIFRQAQDSLIVTNAHRINHGELPLSDATQSKPDFIFLHEEDPAAMAERLQTIYTHLLPKYGISRANTITLVPMKRGPVGTYNLNHLLQNIINPSPADEALTYGNSVFHVHDRVMQLRNNYDKMVFNGDIGYIKQINIADNMVVVEFPEQLVTYESADLDELIMAYAISVHKSQGSEFDAVIVPLFMQHFVLLQRNLVYTAITRAKKLCIFVGQTKAVAVAVKNDKHKERCTFLKAFLTTDLVCR
jgi:exodeoxyribonuclease V alpha subunit